MGDEPAGEMHPSFEHRIDVRRLPARGVRLPFEADRGQCVALARYAGLEDISNFSVECEVVPWRKDGARVQGELKADITQLCVVTLDPVETKIDEPFEAFYVPESFKLAKQHFDEQGQMMLDVEGDDPPEIFSSDELDLGAIWIEFFTLAIDPYPRKPGAELPERFAGGDEEETEKSPFAALSALKNRNSR